MPSLFDCHTHLNQYPESEIEDLKEGVGAISDFKSRLNEVERNVNYMDDHEGRIERLEETLDEKLEDLENENERLKQDCDILHGYRIEQAKLLSELAETVGKFITLYQDREGLVIK